MPSDLDILQPSGKLIKVKNEELVIKPFVFDQFSLACRQINSVKSKMGTIDSDLDLFNLVAQCSEEIKVLCVISSGKDAEWVGALDMADVVRLVGAIIVVNKDFFTQHVMPEVKQMMSLVTPD